ncbi:MAG: hypothetical protein KKB03_03585 [Nanoarchaeota archaeon]|nr:hypothetical protein [Nanoarchaeota archaeon]MBU2520295.1 hypothetical protein [Nanoarchaeota archaeon]
MWLITTLVAAIGATAIWFVAPKKYKLGFLSMMFWGASIMILIDHILGYEGGEFIEMVTEGMITNGTVLGVAMLIPILMIWEIYTIISLKKGGK